MHSEMHSEAIKGRVVLGIEASPNPVDRREGTPNKSEDRRELDDAVIDHALQLLCELLNGQYSIDAMRSDVEDYGDE